MVRRIPPDGAHALDQHLPLLGLALLAAWVAAAVAVVALLCGSRSRKSSTPKTPNPPPTSFPSPSPSKTPAEATAVGEDSLNASAVLPPQQMPPPSGAGAKRNEEEPLAASGLHGPLAGGAPVAPRPRRGLSMNLSMKLPEGLARIRTGRRENRPSNAEDSIWMKTIIMGEKCRVPDEDGEGSAVGLDDKGRRQKNYRPRTPRSLPVSRANSFSEKDGGAIAAQ